MTEKMLAFRARCAAKSAQNKAKGLLLPPQGSVSMADYLKLSEEMNVWRNRAVDAEARLYHSSDVLGEGRLAYLKGQDNRKPQ